LQSRIRNSDHREAIFKCWPDRLAGVNGGEEILRLNDNLILIAGAMPRPLTEGQVIGMLWSKRIAPLVPDIS